jgi:hypothetical protein
VRRGVFRWLGTSGRLLFSGRLQSAYRITAELVSSEGLGIAMSRRYLAVEKLHVSEDLQGDRRHMLRQLAPVAANGCLLAGERGQALRIPRSKLSLEARISKGTVQFGLALSPVPRPKKP